MQEKEITIKKVAQEIVSRIKDDSVSVIWNERIESLVREYLALEFSCKAVSEKIFNDNKEEVIFEALQAVDDKDRFDGHLPLVLQTARKNFTQELSGIRFLIANNSWAVTEFGEELVQFLKGEALQEYHDIAENIDDSVFLESYNALLNRYPELRIRKGD